ncbi:MAG: hypothetical protein Q8P68_04520 [Candidatus Peregrinibacteria bacterium]|nr:hypothetical protein [Candidatus Peregrinibacteria bacterium]
MIPLEKTIRPTQLQPKLYSVIKQLGNTADYRVVVNKDNTPVCILISYSLMQNVDLESMLPISEEVLRKQMREYYANEPEEEKEWREFAIDDGIDEL